MSLAEEDKEWMQRRFDAEREVSRQMTDYIEQRTKGLEGRLQGIDDRLTKMQEQLDAVPSAIERVETSLLTEFHKWAGPNDARMRTHAATLRAIDLEMEALSDRVTKLEPKQ
jgi:hypothetical protein